MSRSVQQKYCGFKSKNKNDLLNMLQEIRCLFNEENEIDNSDLLDNSAEWINNDSVYKINITNKDNIFFFFYYRFLNLDAFKLNIFNKKIKIWIRKTFWLMFLITYGKRSSLIPIW